MFSKSIIFQAWYLAMFEINLRTIRIEIIIYFNTNAKKRGRFDIYILVCFSHICSFTNDIKELLLKGFFWQLYQASCVPEQRYEDFELKNKDYRKSSRKYKIHNGELYIRISTAFSTRFSLLFIKTFRLTF